MSVCLCVCMFVWLYVCMFVCLYVCVYVCIHVCIYVCIHVCICVCMYVCMSISPSLSLYIYTHAYVYVYMCIMYAYTYTIIHVYIYIYTYIHIYVYIITCVPTTQTWASVLSIWFHGRPVRSPSHRGDGNDNFGQWLSATRKPPVAVRLANGGRIQICRTQATAGVLYSAKYSTNLECAAGKRGCSDDSAFKRCHALVQWAVAPCASLWHVFYCGWNPSHWSNTLPGCRVLHCSRTQALHCLSCCMGVPDVRSLGQAPAPPHADRCNIL